MKLFLDHLYCTIPSDVFSELQSFFKHVPSFDCYWVDSNHGKWHGIYVFPKHGGFLEFLEITERDARGTHGIAFSRHGDEKDLGTFLEKQIPSTHWEHHIRTRPDGSSYYKSSYLKGFSDL
jgi:hypothetical protein